MACEKALVIVLISLCSSWNPRAEAADGEDEWVVNRCCIALLPVLATSCGSRVIDTFGRHSGRWCDVVGGTLSIRQCYCTFIPYN